MGPFALKSGHYPLRPPIKPNFWNKVAAWCAKQNFKQNEGLFVKIYWTISELQYFFIDIPTKILKNGVILVPFQFSGPTYKSSLISLKKPYFAGTKIEYEYWKIEYKNTSPPTKKKKKKKLFCFFTTVCTMMVWIFVTDI